MSVPNVIIAEKTFFDNATSISTSEEFFITGGMGTLKFEVEITGSATVIFETQIKKNWYPAFCVNLDNKTAPTEITESGNYQPDIASISKIRFRISNFSSGNVSIYSKISS